MTRSNEPRRYLGVADLRPQEMRDLLRGALEQKSIGWRPAVLAERSIALIFEGPSVRTRFSFDLAVRQCGAHAVYLSPADFAQMKSSTLRDQGRELGLYFDCLVARIIDHADLEALASHCQAPVVNAMTRLEHPCQALGDMLTLLELFGEVQGLKIACVGHSPVINSVLIAGAGMGAEVTVATPPGLEPPQRVLDTAKQYGGEWTRPVVTADLALAVTGADVVYADLWADWVDQLSEEETVRWKDALRPYQVTSDVLARAKPTAVFMHCMPVKRGEEVTAEVVDGLQSVVLMQVENRLHAQRALLSYLVGDDQLGSDAAAGGGLDIGVPA